MIVCWNCGKDWDMLAHCGLKQAQNGAPALLNTVYNIHEKGCDNCEFFMNESILGVLKYVSEQTMVASDRPELAKYAPSADVVCRV